MKGDENGAAVEKYELAKYFSGTASVKRIRNAQVSDWLKRPRHDAVQNLPEGAHEARK